MTIIFADPELAATAPAYVLPSVGDTLRRAADAVEALRHPRVSPVDLHRALSDAAGRDPRQAKAALDAFAFYLGAVAAGDDRWPYGWTGPRGRDAVAGLLRKAADYDKGPAAGRVQTFGADAHYAYRIRFDGQEPILLSTEPAACKGGCGGYCCQAIDQTGRRVPVHAAASTPITVLAAPGGGR